MATRQKPLTSGSGIRHITAHFQSALHISTSKSPVMCIFITFLEGMIGNCVLVDATVTYANVAPQGFDSLTCYNTLVKVVRNPLAPPNIAYLF